MAPNIGQILAAGYNSVVAEKRKPANQWAENATLREFQRLGFIKVVDLGPKIEWTIDYRRNPNAGFLTSDLQPISLDKTEVIDAAQYDIAEIAVPIVWSNKDEVATPRTLEKVAFVASLVDNGLNSHDDLLEQAFYQTSTNGFLGLKTHVTSAGTGSDGSIDSTTNTFWRNQTNTYVDDTDIEPAMTKTWNACAKGSGSKIAPVMITSDANTQALFEGTQQGQQRYVDTDELKAGFKILAFKTSRYSFSQYGDTNLYFLSPMAIQVRCAKGYFRNLGEPAGIPNAMGTERKIYTACQMAVGNRSRLGIVHL